MTKIFAKKLSSLIVYSKKLILLTYLLKKVDEKTYKKLSVMSIDLVERRVLVTFSFDEENNLYTFSLLEKGGPIIVSDDFEKGKERMDKALDFSFAVRNLQYFDDISFIKRDGLMRSNSESKKSVEYLKLQTT